ncbi:hypothetical protein [Roseateles sp. BYS87W]|uniref:CdiI immunity protein domain-containing protein n=1 Tax=Pelomonas baiyunensis TaxID=3299026 RepID=A0ABW7H2U1_9BURK
MSGTVTDVLAFAAKYTDYWDEILDGEPTYDSVLSAEELKAFEAARVHINESVYDLLKLCGDKLTECARLDKQEFPMPRFQRDKTQQKRRVQVLKQATNPGKIYGAFFSLEGNADGVVKLYASVSVYKEIIESVKDSLKTEGVEFGEYDGYCIYSPGIELKQSLPFSALAEKAAQHLWKFLISVRKQAG